MSLLRRILPGVLVLLGVVVGAILSSRKATRYERKATERAIRSAELAHDNQLDAAAEEAGYAEDLKKAAADHKAKAQKRIEEVAQHDPTLAAVITAYNGGVRERARSGPESLDR